MLECISLLGRPRRRDIHEVLKESLVGTYKDEHSFINGVNLIIKRLVGKGYIIENDDVRWTTTKEGETFLKICQYKDLLKDPKVYEEIKEFETTIR